MTQRLLAVIWFLGAMAMAYGFVNVFVRVLFWVTTLPIMRWASTPDGTSQFLYK